MWSCFQDQNFSCDISFVMIDTHLHRDNGSVSSNDNWIDKLGEKWPMNDKSGKYQNQWHSDWNDMYTLMLQHLSALI